MKRHQRTDMKMDLLKLTKSTGKIIKMARITESKKEMKSDTIKSYLSVISKCRILHKLSCVDQD